MRRNWCVHLLDMFLHVSSWFCAYLFVKKIRHYWTFLAGFRKCHTANERIVSHIIRKNVFSNFHVNLSTIQPYSCHKELHKFIIYIILWVNWVSELLSTMNEHNSTYIFLLPGAHDQWENQDWIRTKMFTWLYNIFGPSIDVTASHRPFLSLSSKLLQVSKTRVRSMFLQVLVFVLCWFHHRHTHSDMNSVSSYPKFPWYWGEAREMC